jgi:hypothetical protein
MLYQENVNLPKRIKNKIVFSIDQMGDEELYFYQNMMGKWKKKEKKDKEENKKKKK